MSDVIRLDPDEMLEICEGLLRLSARMDEAYMELQRLRFGLPDSVFELAAQDLAQQGRRLLLAMQRAEGLGKRALWALEEFVRCEQELTAQALEQEAEMAAFAPVLPRKQGLKRGK